MRPRYRRPEPEAEAYKSCKWMKSDETTGLRTNALVSSDIVAKYKQALFNRKRKLGKRQWKEGCLGKLLHHFCYFPRLVSTGLPLFEPGIHNPEPQGWHVADENHERVAKR